MEAIPEFAKEYAPYLRRTAWRDFPDVVIHADESVVKKHPLYAAAKAGDARAANLLALEMTTVGALDRISVIIGAKRPHLLAVHAFETEGVNVIPRVLAKLLSRLLALPVTNGIIQLNRVSHTGADGYHRLASPALFGGEVKEREYFLVDDFIGQGGTLANLKGYIEDCGAAVLGATVLTGKAYSAKLSLSPETLQALRGKHGNELEQWWLATFGYSFERLTESECRYLTRADDAHAVSTRIAAAGRERD